MAEPVIISYARGLLKEFPGLPEGVVDVIPVDLVVAAILAVAARGPATDGRPDVFQVGLGRPQPAALPPAGRPGAGLVPRAPAVRQPRASRSSCRSGRSPAGAGSSASSQQATRACRHGREGAPGAARSGAARPSWTARLEERRAEAERALGYVELYGAYTETEAVLPASTG